MAGGRPDMAVGGQTSPPIAGFDWCGRIWLMQPPAPAPTPLGKDGLIFFKRINLDYTCPNQILR